ncbi:hypothetical protein NM688_g4577 [Phlebia brevispora]|uniref:Uncharacterized protein n=1 Tax=Phlebia brevispora TaxID=194682 RepID=A0ACC1T293_9APHY|nr:hypothetical protein NM688_g4577 [Phlebia brevispora]
MHLPWMMEYRRAERKQRAETADAASRLTKATQLPQVHNVQYKKATKAQGSGLRRIADLERSFEELEAAAADSTAETAAPRQQTATAIDEEAQERDAVRHDELIVRAELAAYTTAGLLDSGSEDTDSLDLLEYWRSNEKTYPILFRIAMDVLPVQASAVACERIFSSSKETDTLRRRRLTPVMMEVLQMLKQSYLRQALHIPRDWLTTEEELLEEEKAREEAAAAEDMHTMLMEGNLASHADTLVNEQPISFDADESTSAEWDFTLPGQSTGAEFVEF